MRDANGLVYGPILYRLVCIFRLAIHYSIRGIGPPHCTPPLGAHKLLSYDILVELVKHYVAYVRYMYYMSTHLAISKSILLVAIENHTTSPHDHNHIHINIQVDLHSFSIGSKLNYRNLPYLSCWTSPSARLLSDSSFSRTSSSVGLLPNFSISQTLFGLLHQLNSIRIFPTDYFQISASILFGWSALAIFFLEVRTSLKLIYVKVLHQPTSVSSELRLLNLNERAHHDNGHLSL